MAALWVLVLVTAELGLTRASPVPTSKPATTRSGCNFSRFKSLSPRELAAFKKAKDAWENSLENWNCSSRLFPRTRDLKQLQVWERPIALEAELALTLKVLGTMADSSLGDILDQPLHTLRHIHSELWACILAQPTAGARPRGRLHHWLRRLQEAPEKESQGCREASVMFNLFRLLKKDLECVASRDLCV
ncbi:interferon lambda-1-like [Manis javanica]|uniref:interferon lambda-1-like n=1 Tax=Manis javanica TaxID=9974 RepID=UPI0008138BBA|nr:interferon lambda-1-like [Manis javanica]KAI5930168.1 Interferon lambda-1 [Manis javanica]